MCAPRVVIAGAGGSPPRPALELAAGALDPQGPAAESIADLWWIMLGLGVAVFVLVAVLLAVGLFRRGGRSDGGAIGAEPASAARWLVGGGVVLPVVVLVVVFAATIESMREAPAEADADGEDLVIEIVGHQWWWEVRYPEEGFTTANEVHMPVGRPVTFELTSADVIHSFWVPALGGKRDLLPEGMNTLVLQADEPGEHLSACAEFCGLQHALMKLVVVAEPPEQFSAWVADQQEPAAELAGAQARQGRDVFVTQECASCHVVRGAPGTGGDGPDLTHVATRPTLGAGAVSNTPPHLAEWVTDPHAIKAGVAMPSVELTDGELDDLLAYLGSLR